MHKWRLWQKRDERISRMEDNTDTPYDLVRRKTYQKRDIAFWCAFIGGMVAAGAYFVVDLVRTVR